jgi:hypothetical protein
MPSGIFPTPAFTTVPPRQLRAGLRLRSKTRLRRSRLDAELAAGADPHTTPELSLRAAQLRSEKERARIATALLEAVRAGDSEARAYAEEVGALAKRLLDDLPVDVHGAAMAARLVSAGEGLRRDLSGPDMRHAIIAARTTLDARRVLAADLRAAA